MVAAAWLLYGNGEPKSIDTKHRAMDVAIGTGAGSGLTRLKFKLFEHKRV